MEKQLIQKITKVVKEHESDYPSNFKYAKVLDINPAQLSLILRDKTYQVLSQQKWMSIARRLDVNLNGGGKWVTVRTPVFEYIYEQMRICQEQSIAGILCDRPDIGKTYTAKQYVKENKNAIYIDCSQVKSKTRLIRKIAREFGVSQNGVYSELYDDLTYYLKFGVRNPNPLIILDEAGDLSPEAFLELKAFWNATEDICGWYMMGADGLKAMITRSIQHKKVGSVEILSRYGNDFKKVLPDGREECNDFLESQVVSVAKANGLQNVAPVIARCDGSLRRLYIEVKKQKRNGKST